MLHSDIHYAILRFMGCQVIEDSLIEICQVCSGPDGVVGSSCIAMSGSLSSSVAELMM